MFVRRRRSLVTPSVALVSKVQFSHPQSEDSKDDPILRGRVEKISGFTSRRLSKVQGWRRVAVFGSEVASRNELHPTMFTNNNAVKCAI